MNAPPRNHGKTRRLHYQGPRGQSICGQEAISKNDVLTTVLRDRVTCQPCRTLLTDGRLT